MRLPDLRRIARIAIARCTREAKFEGVQRHYITTTLNEERSARFIAQLLSALMSALFTACRGSLEGFKTEGTQKLFSVKYLFGGANIAYNFLFHSYTIF